MVREKRSQPLLEWAKRWRKCDSSNSDFVRHEKFSNCGEFSVCRSRFLLIPDEPLIFYALKRLGEIFDIVSRHSTEQAAKNACQNSR